MSVTVTLSTPGSLDFRAFSLTTRKLLARLGPLIELKERSSLAPTSSLPLQVVEFVTAIRRGIRAAQCGFTVADDIIDLGLAREAPSTHKDQIAYLMGTLRLGDEALNESREAYRALSSARRQMFTLSDAFRIQRYHGEPLGASEDSDSDEPRELKWEKQEEEIEYILGTFTEQISELAKWWDWIQIETNLHETAAIRSFTFDISSLKQESVIDRWKHIRSQLLEYTNMVKEMEDRFPELFSMTIESATYNALQSSESDGGIAARADLRLATKCYPLEDIHLVEDAFSRVTSEPRVHSAENTKSSPSGVERSAAPLVNLYGSYGRSCICCLIS